MNKIFHSDKLLSELKLLKLIIEICQIVKCVSKFKFIQKFGFGTAAEAYARFFFKFVFSEQKQRAKNSPLTPSRAYEKIARKCEDEFEDNQDKNRARLALPDSKYVARAIRRHNAKGHIIVKDVRSIDPESEPEESINPSEISEFLAQDE